MNKQPQITAKYTLDSVTRLRIVRELHELIAALDRRVPHVERVREAAIAKAASVLVSTACADPVMTEGVRPSSAVVSAAASTARERRDR